MKKNIFFVCALNLLLAAGFRVQVQAQSPAQAQSQTPSIAWMSFEQALEENGLRVAAGLPPKKVYVDVYTDWCGWCKRLDATTFANPEIVAYMNSMFLPVKLNAERTDTVRVGDQIFVNPGAGQPRPGGRGTTHQLAAQLLNGKMSYPSCTFLDESGKPITVVPGYMEAKQFEMLLHFIAEDGYKAMGWEAYQQWYAPRARIK